MNPVDVVTAEEFLGKLAAASAAYDASGIVLNDELDQTEVAVCALIPESSVAVLIGTGGANVNAVKATSGTNISFAKKENSVGGLRKCFVTGTLAQVSKAIWIKIHVVGESQIAKGDSVAFGIVVKTEAAGSVIGKGGENLKSIREQTGCHTNMEKTAAPMVGGRTLTMRQPESPQAVFQGLYLAMRLPGFLSQTNKEDRALVNKLNNPMAAYDPNPASNGYGAAPTSHGGKARFSPYGGNSGAAATGGLDLCTICAIHNKKRGSKNLVPHPTEPGLYTCMADDQCKGQGGASAGLTQADAASVCATHGKQRGARNLQPHATTAGLYVCLEGDLCK